MSRAAAPEGPQLDSIAPDISEAIDDDDDARRFFESLPIFYLGMTPGHSPFPTKRIENLNQKILFHNVRRRRSEPPSELARLDE